MSIPPLRSRLCVCLGTGQIRLLHGPVPCVRCKPGLMWETRREAICRRGRAKRYDNGYNTKPGWTPKYKLKGKD